MSRESRRTRKAVWTRCFIGWSGPGVQPRGAIRIPARGPEYRGTGRPPASGDITARGVSQVPGTNAPPGMCLSTSILSA